MLSFGGPKLKIQLYDLNLLKKSILDVSYFDDCHDISKQS